MTQEMKDAKARKVECLWDYLRATAQNYGFTVKEFPFGREIWDETRTVNFTVLMDTDFDMEKRTVTETYSVSASIATMGGNPTGDELKERGMVIMKAGQMVNTIGMFPSGLKIEYEF